MTRACGLIFVFCALALPATYFVDSEEGSDTNDGDSLQSPWKTLEKVNSVELKPGDRVLFRSGVVFKGVLAPKGKGTEAAPIVISRFPDFGGMPRIEGTGEDAVLIRNMEHVVVTGLEVVNDGDNSAVKRGIHVLLDNYGTAKGIVVRGNWVHDVRGTQKQKETGGIIFTTRGDETPSRFDGLRIEKNVIWKVDRSGIAAQSSHWPRTKWFPSLNVVIRDNYLEDIGGDGVVPWACDGVVVEHNILRGANMRAKSYNAGIWPWSCDNSKFRWNDVAGVKTLMDGQGFDSDYNSRNTLFEYNYSHDNEGGFILICTPGKRNVEENIGNLRATVRRNISRNDRERIFHISAVEEALVEDNVIYTGPGIDVQMVLFSDWDGWANGVTIRRNRFVTEGTARYGFGKERREDGSYGLAPGWGQAKNVKVEENFYSGKHVGMPEKAQVLNLKAPQRDWEGPKMDPSKPEGLEEFLKKHRAWMDDLMRAHYVM